ncbi:MAG: hypothetical protein V4539_03175 [Bacteroidota bacterium]
MSQENLEYLKNQLRFTGFGEGLFDSLAKNMDEKKPLFQLAVTHELDGQPLSAVLHFSCSSAGNYFFNRYDASLDTAHGKREHPFYIHRNAKLNISFREAGNLLSGRALKAAYVKQSDRAAFEKGEEVPIHKVWMQLDLKSPGTNGRYRITRYYSNYGYEIEPALERVHLKEQIFSDQLAQLISQLEAGNRCRVQLHKAEGATQIVLLEACPMFRSFLMFDLEGKALYVPKMKEAKEIPVEVKEMEKVDEQKTIKKRKRIAIA